MPNFGRPLLHHVCLSLFHPFGRWLTLDPTMGLRRRVVLSGGAGDPRSECTLFAE